MSVCLPVCLSIWMSVCLYVTIIDENRQEFEREQGEDIEALEGRKGRRKGLILL